MSDSVVIAAPDGIPAQLIANNGQDNCNSNFENSVDNSAHQTMASLNYTPN